MEPILEEGELLNLFLCKRRECAEQCEPVCTEQYGSLVYIAPSGVQNSAELCAW